MRRTPLIRPRRSSGTEPIGAAMNPVIACGIDIIEIARVRRVFARFGPRFLARVYGERGRAGAAARRDPVPYLAGRFAAKEAVLKVLGCSLFAGVPLASIEIRAGDSGEPLCELHGSAARRAAALGVARVLVSISHCGSHAVAQAIGIAEQPARAAARRSAGQTRRPTPPREAR